MAISEDLPGVAVTITTGGRELSEYDSIELRPLDGTVDCLIAATTNQIFTIKCTADETTEFEGSMLVFKVYVDGEDIDLKAIEKADMITSFSTTSSLGLKETVDTLRRYRFTNVKSVGRESLSLSSRSPSSTASSSPSSATSAIHTPTTGEEFSASSIISATTAAYPSNMTELGTIKVEVYQAYLGEEVPFGPTRSVLVADKMKKLAARYNALSHFVSFTAPERRETKCYYDAVPVRDPLKPATTFIFHYRSSRMLRSMFDKQPSTNESSPKMGVSASVLTNRLRDVAVSQASAAQSSS